MRPTSFVIAVLALTACARVHSQSGSTVMLQGGAHPTRGRVTDHVVVISIDGLRPDAIAKYGAKTLQRLMLEGRYSLTAQTIAVSNTLPSHTSMLTGVDSDKHGITWNADRTAELGFVHVPTIFGLAHAAGFSTAAFFSKTKFNALEVPGTLDFVMSQEGELGLPWGAARTEGYVHQYLKAHSPNLLFVHLADADFAGHNFGWMGRMYGYAVREVDNAVAKVLRDAEAQFGHGNYTVLVTSDHGGHGKRHGSTDPRDTTIPWIIWGQGVQRGDTLSGIRTMDTAASALWMLGVNVPDTFTGRAMTAAFEPSFAQSR